MYYRSYYYSFDNKICRGFFDVINDFFFRVNVRRVITVRYSRLVVLRRGRLNRW